MGSGWYGRRTLGAEELARDVELLAADNNNLLAVQKLLGDSGGQAAEKVALAVDDNLCISISHCCSSPCPSSIYPPGRAGARKGDSVSGMRTTGSKVDILLRLVRVVIDGLVVYRRMPVVTATLPEFRWESHAAKNARKARGDLIRAPS